MLFESSKVRLRKVTIEDTELYQTWRNDMEVMRNTNPSLDIYTIEATRDFVERVILGSNTAKGYMILEKESEKPIGITSLMNIDDAECMIDIGEKDFWGKGYGREALTLLLNYAFLEMNLHRVYLRVFSFNKKAIRLYEKLGFSHEGTSRVALFREGVWHDIVHMGLLQGEYFKQREKSSDQQGYR